MAVAFNSSFIEGVDTFSLIKNRWEVGSNIKKKQILFYWSNWDLEKAKYQ